jgi:Major Facilitator Superfamily.
MHMKIPVKKFVSKIYYNQKPLSDQDYTKGTRLFLLEGISANAIAGLTTGSFLSGFLTSLGVEDSLNGIVGSIPVLLCAVQLFSSVIFENIKQKKFLIALFAFIHRVLLSFMFLVPFLVKGMGARVIFIIALFFLSHFCGNFIGTGAGNWMLKLLRGKNVGKYLGIKDACALAALTLTTLTMGYILDRFRAKDAEANGFLLIGALVLILAFINFLCFSLIKEPNTPKNSRLIKLKNVLIEPLKDKRFRKIMIFCILWNLSLQVAGPFFAVYNVSRLKLDYTYITVVSLISAVARVCAATIWGRLADKKSWFWVIKSSMFLLGIVHVGWFFMSKDSYLILQPLLQIFSGIAWGGIAISVFNLPYIYAPEEAKVMYVGANSAYAGIFGFIATLIGASIVGLFKQVTILGLDISGIQILFAISGFSILGCVFYVKKVLEKF